MPQSHVHPGSHSSYIPFLAYGLLRGISYSKEGQNIEQVSYGFTIAQTTGDCGEEGFIYQELCTLHEFDWESPFLGSWIIGQESAGIGIRESDTLITDNLSRFVPHLIS